MAVEVTDQPADGRFEATVDGTHAGAAYYELSGDMITFTHTEVDSEFEGRGVGSALARYGLDQARDASLRVRPLCPFIARWIQRHPDYAGLVVEGR
jgi:predicted GNAT family acetyltransferase